MADRVTTPQDGKAEQMVLGGCMLAPEVIAEVAGFLRSEDFFSRKNRAFWEAITHLHDEGEPIEWPLVVQWLKEHDPEEADKAASYAASLTEFVPSPATVPAYARIVADKALRRRLQGLGHKLLTEAADESREALEHAERARVAIEGVSAGAHDSDGVVSLSEAMTGVYDDVREALESGKQRGFKTGIPALDRRLSLRPSSLLVVAAREKTGKSWLAQWIALELACREQRALIVTTEMPPEEYAERVMESWGEVPRFSLESPQDETDLVPLERAMDRMQQLPVDFMHEESADIVLRKAHHRAAKPATRPSMLLIDYLQRLSLPREWGEGDTARIKEAARRIKNFANRHRVPVVLVSSVTRPPKGQEHKFPEITDIYGGQAIAHEADAVLMIHRRGEFDMKLTEFRVVAGRHARDRQRWFMVRDFEHGVFRETDYVPTEAA